MANNETSRLRTGIVRLARTHFLIATLIVAQIMVYDAWQLIDPSTVLKRWIIAATLLVVSSAVWYMARGRTGELDLYKKLVFVLVVADIFVASVMVYFQRGMASRAVFLYAAPIIVSSILTTRSAIFTATALSIAAYTTATISYFVLNFNEGYKIELYGEVGFYSVFMLLLAELMWSIVRKKRG